MSAPAYVLVTGASRGIGRAVAERLLREGRTVALVARDEARLRAVAAPFVGRAHVLVCDLGDRALRARLVDRAADLLGGLDGLVSAAGIVRYARAVDTTDDDADALLETNFFAPFALARAAAARMESGAIVHVASTLGVASAPLCAAYAASKAALLSLTRSLAQELAPRVRVNAVLPGVVDTDMVHVPRLERGEPMPTGAALTGRIAHELEQVRQLHPLGRLGTPEDVAAACVFLLDAPWVTGTELVVDGGLLVR